YEKVSAGGTGHREAVKVTYDPARVGYEELLDVFWHSVNPLDDGGQFCDRGDSYTSAIFTGDEEQMRLAQASKQAIDKSGELDQPIVTPILPAGKFYPAEGYHQDYYKKNPIRYKFYRYLCGRDAELRQVWGE
ncbi:MAG: peptide-methionine (S)-S-oxide reductase MsrA, partial [Gammaproteobacteria bacterium]|nr:peptide-methionine (S)-S-oxide reductase MsrA [Gammaproteobacteria bacterium]